MSLAINLLATFAIGLATPLTAVCVIPLYPGFLAYLANQSQSIRTPLWALGGVVVAGVVAFMLVVGVVFSTVLESSLTNVVTIVSPVAFGVLGLLSVLLLVNADVSAWVPTLEPPTTRHPIGAGFSYGFFFGAIVLPCNPALIAFFFARSFLFQTPVGSVLNFFAFGLGMGFPLLVFAIASERWNTAVLGFLTAHHRRVNQLTGAIMLVISLYYLLIVFDLLSLDLSLAPGVLGG